MRLLILFLLLLPSAYPAHGSGNGFYSRGSVSDTDPDRSIAVMTVRAEVIQGQTASWSYPDNKDNEHDLIHHSSIESQNNEQAILTLSYLKDTEMVIEVNHPAAQVLKKNHHIIHTDDSLPSDISPCGEVHISLTWRKGESVKSQVIIEYI